MYLVEVVPAGGDWHLELLADVEDLSPDLFDLCAENRT